MNYTSKNFHLHYVSRYRLIIKSGFATDTLIVVDEDNEVQAFHSYPSEEPSIEATKLLGLPFQKIFIGLPLQSLVFIPSEVYNTEDREIYQEFLLDDKIERSYRCDIENLGVTGYFQFDLLLLNRWQAIFPQANFMADFQVVLRDIQAYIPAEGTVLGVHVRDKQVELFVFIRERFQLYNIFDIETPDDLQYFILHVCRLLAISRIDKILVSGIDAEHTFMEVLRQHAHTIEFVKSTLNLYSNDIDVVKEAQLLNILADFPLCVS
ncbi:DUF3822 family protein [Sphingobacterium sp. LRF_L2]|uniref:DUF3822 family protein n=1 Tax=Sphingobacterium sp. LRF_L2 TaxID=3369421 RepID=UPI003F603BD3